MTECQCQKMNRLSSKLKCIFVKCIWNINNVCPRAWIFEADADTHFKEDPDSPIIVCMYVCMYVFVCMYLSI